ncbi:uncharacterized protein LOC123537454 [Mercenaria mercenaria]|uniref:uncharacterized protein LOC123537454 n=1 Tax=Mercenaria mercenaria TaxID=6596 RepID=UPI00234ECD85|nr:uncharacterized protein LOC123537454 [Mercenaria mercenaria]
MSAEQVTEFCLLAIGFFTIYIDPWETCLQSHSESVASCLLEKNILPNKRQLEEIAKIFDGKQKSSIVRKCCSKISENIKGLSEKINGVWPAYRFGENGKENFAFVICTNEDIDLNNRLKYEYKIRVIGKCNNEARDVTFSTENISYKMNPDDTKKIKMFIAKNSRDLLKRQSMLSGISASSVKSKKYSTNKWEKVPCPCLVFYVHTKNYIPLDEDPFEKEYDGIPVDVREGAFTRFGRDGHCSTKYQPDVKIACEIRGANSSGTLSGFLELPDSTDIFGFTCAHAVLSTDVLRKYLLKSGNKSFNVQPANADEKLESMVYQPVNSEEVLGNVVKVAYQEGGKGTSGMEIAIVKLQKARYPISGKISDFESETNEHTFETGKVAERASIQYGEDVVKFGSTSGISQGRIAFDDATVRGLSFPWNKDDCVILYNQLEVWSLNLHERFAVNGDSGAPVYVSRNDELNCVGIVEGGYDIGNCVVTPVDGLLRELAIRSLKDFRGYPSRKEKSETTNIKQDVLPRHVRKRKCIGRLH